MEDTVDRGPGENGSPRPVRPGLGSVLLHSKGQRGARRERTAQALKVTRETQLLQNFMLVF